VTTVELIGVGLVCVVVILATVAFLLVVAHQRRMVSTDGSLTVAYRHGTDRWSNGVGRYAGDEFVWYRTLTLSPTAAVRLPRKELSVVQSRTWDPNTDMALRPNLSIVECDFRGERISLGFPDNGLMGFLSWLEASAPRF
jgi:Protein of unknown function (DUF2550)